MISIIIPTLNEEKYLPKLLRSVKEQNFDGDLEIIVADANSKDKTREIAQEFGCKIVQGGYLSKGRNEGAKVAKGDILLFIDADIVLPKDFLSKAMKEFLNRKLDGACFLFQLLEDNFWQKLLFNIFYNFPVQIFSRIWPHGSMVFLIKKKNHEEINGFDEEIIFLEDIEYVRRLSKRLRYKMIKSTKIFASPRRFEEDGWITAYLKCLIGDIYMTFFGPIKKDIFHYKFNHYDI
jgi:glycosyltransferase involved in cell wall biosynthesis